MRHRMIVRIVTLLVTGIFAATAPFAVRAGIENLPDDIQIPSGYRDWKLLSVAHEAGALNDIRAILGNDLAIRSYRERQELMPEGAIIARVAWDYVSSAENNKAFGREQSYVAGKPTNVQFMIKNSSKYASSGGWGFAQFTDGKPANEAVSKVCFSCHQSAKEHDFVFTHYAP